VLSGVCAAALSQFPSTVDEDEALLSGSASVATAAGSGSAAGEAGTQLSTDMRLAVEYRAGLKRLLVTAIQALGARVQEVPTLPGLKASAVATAQLRAGQKPRAATGKGFGAKGGASNGTGA
jgi:hypothetical protein